MSENWRLLIPSIYTKEWWGPLLYTYDEETVSRCSSEESFAIHLSYNNFDKKEICNKNSKTGETSMLGGEEPRRCHPNALWQDLTVESGVEVARLDTAWTQGRPLTGHHTSTATQQEKKGKKEVKCLQKAQ